MQGVLHFPIPKPTTEHSEGRLSVGGEQSPTVSGVVEKEYAATACWVVTAVGPLGCPLGSARLGLAYI